MKDKPYFKHDIDARSDCRVIKIRQKFGAKGYGIYFMLIEILRSSKKYETKLDLDTLAFDIHEEKETIKEIIHNYGLFKINKDIFYSPSLKTRMKNLDNIRNGWTKGGKKRWENQTHKKRNPGYTPEEAKKLGLH